MPSGPREPQIAKLLYEIHRDAITVTPTPDGYQVRLSIDDSPTVNADAPPSTCFSIAFQLTMITALAVPEISKGWTTQPLTIEAIHKLRSAVAQQWSDNHADCPNLLMEHYAALTQAHLAEAYDQWLFREARPTDWNDWLHAHADEVRALPAWFNSHKLAPAPGDHFGIDHY